jgi:hypothetical protein
MIGDIASIPLVDDDINGFLSRTKESTGTSLLPGGL